MPIFTHESLDTLRQRINLVDVVSQHIELKKAGGLYKGLCPFHDEKSPSFCIQPGAATFHCFGCQAHGDAIAFLMRHLNLSFSEAVESLAEQFHLTMETAGKHSAPLVRTPLRHMLNDAHLAYHLFLTKTEEGRTALNYLFERGIDWDFIERFEIGYAPQGGYLLVDLLRRLGYEENDMRLCGLISSSGSDFFKERITFPIRNNQGHVVGFSARKFHEETFGGKYINSPEHPLFKKSHLLFGFSESRKRIAKERKAIIVEGQIDALRLIQEGFDYTVAGQGTAFGSFQVKQLLDLKIQEVFLALDGDTAGKKAAQHIGDLFQSEGIEVRVVNLPSGQDPDSFLRSKGPSAFEHLLQNSEDYLHFLIRYLQQDRDLDGSAALKTEVFEALSQQIQNWKHPLMVHESLKKVSQLLQIPSQLLPSSPVPVKKIAHREKEMEPHKALEIDILRCLVTLKDESHIKLCQTHLNPIHFVHPLCQRFFICWKEKAHATEPFDLLHFASLVQDDLAEKLLDDLAEKALQPSPSPSHLFEAIERLQLRHWTHEKQQLYALIMKTTNDEEQTKLLKAFDLLQKNPPPKISNL